MIKRGKMEKKSKKKALEKSPKKLPGKKKPVPDASAKKEGEKKSEEADEVSEEIEEAKDLEDPADPREVSEEDAEEVFAAGDDSKRGYKNSLFVYFDEIRAARVLGAKEEKQIIGRAQRGDAKAREEIIKCNLKLVVKIAKRYEYFGVPLIDLIEEGNIGLMKAVEKFKISKGFRFSTYATWWIKQSINRAIANQKNTIRIPVHILDIYHKYLKLIEKEIKDRGVFPDRDTAAKKLKIETVKLNEILNIIKAPKSLDLEYESEDSDSGRTLKDTIEDSAAVKPDDDFFERDKNEKILQVIEKLKPKEKEVILNRFGLDNRNILTLEEIGEKMKLTRERIRQIEMIAIKKLKNIIKSSEKD